MNKLKHNIVSNIKSNRQERIDLIERAKQRLSEIRIKKNSTIESKNEVDEDDPLGIKKQTSYAPQVNI